MNKKVRSRNEGKESDERKMSQRETVHTQTRQKTQTNVENIFDNACVCLNVFSRSITSGNLRMFVNRNRLALHYLMSA